MLVEIKGHQIEINPEYGKVVSMVAFEGVIIVACEHMLLTFKREDFS